VIVSFFSGFFLVGGVVCSSLFPLFYPIFFVMLFLFFRFGGGRLLYSFLLLSGFVWGFHSFFLVGFLFLLFLYFCLVGGFIAGVFLLKRDPPRALETDENSGHCRGLRQGRAQNAKEAGFDGVEIHGATASH